MALACRLVVGGYNKKKYCRYMWKTMSEQTKRHSQIYNLNDGEMKEATKKK